MIGLAYVADGLVLVMEDDDWYHPEYVQTVVDAFEPHLDMIGVAPSHYYHLPTKTHRCCANQHHASLAQTAFRTKISRQVIQTCKNKSPSVDLRLWNSNSGIPRDLIPNKASDGRLLHLGLKGMPGEPGIGMGHRLQPKSDPHGKRLRDMLGVDAEDYDDFLGKAVKP
jgi:hypothetical protein